MNSRLNWSQCWELFTTSQSPPISLLQGLEDPVNTGCKSCGNREEPGEGVESIVPIESSSCNCPATTILGSPKTKNGKSFLLLLLLSK